MVDLIDSDDGTPKARVLTTCLALAHPECKRLGHSQLRPADRCEFVLHTDRAASARLDAPASQARVQETRTSARIG